MSNFVFVVARSFFGCAVGTAVGRGGAGRCACTTISGSTSCARAAPANAAVMTNDNATRRKGAKNANLHGILCMSKCYNITLHFAAEVKPRLNRWAFACIVRRPGPRRLHIYPARIPHAVFHVPGLPAGLRDRPQCAVGRARQGRGLRRREENRSCRAARLAAGARHVLARPSGAGRLRPCQERCRPASPAPSRRNSRTTRRASTSSRSASRKTVAYLKTLDRQGDRRRRRPRDHLSARAEPRAR